MRKCFLLLFLVCWASGLFAQDVIYQKNGEKLTVKITELADDYVKFYYFEDPDKVQIKMNRSLIRSIQFEYGRKETEIQPGLEESYYVDDKENNILLNFGGVASKSTMISYERAVNAFSSFGGGVKIHGLGAGSTDKSGFGLEGNYKVKMGNIFKKDEYRPDHLLHGFYVRPDVGFTNSEIKYGYSGYEDTEDYTYLYGGFDIGKEWVFNNMLTLDIFTGINFYGGSYSDGSPDDEINDHNYIDDGNMSGEDGTAARYGLQLGMLF